MAEGRPHRAMHRRPVGPSSRKEVLQAEQPRGPTHSDPQRIAIVSRWYPGPARQTFFTERMAAEIPRRAEEQRDSADVERSAEQRDDRSEEHTSELQSRLHLVCRLLLEKKKETAVYTRTGLTSSK